MLQSKEPTVKPFGGFKTISVKVSGLFNTIEIDQAWGVIHSILGKIEQECGEIHVFGRCHKAPHETAEGVLYYEACVSYPEHVEVELPENVELIDIPEQSYAVFVHKGSYDSLEDSYKYIFEEYVPNNAGNLAEAPFLEVYLNNPKFTPVSDLITELCLPVNN